MSRSLYPACHFTRKGLEILQQNDEVRDVLDVFWDASDPEVRIGGRFLGNGRYATVREIGGIAVKVSSPTSSRDSFESGQPGDVEDLALQYRFQKQLRRHLAGHGSGLVVPRQYFVARSAHQAFMLGQEYMDGWTRFDDWCDTVLGPDDNETYETLCRSFRERILGSVAGTKFEMGLNDLKLDSDKIHTGNILVPVNAAVSEDLQMCIIDQPGRFASQPALTDELVR